MADDKWSMSNMLFLSERNANYVCRTTLLFIVGMQNIKTDNQKSL